MTSWYRRITAPSQAIVKEKRSQFIAQVLPAATVHQAREAIEAISKDHSDASHNCWAYRVGYPSSQCHCSDDGEPSGSAGRPILGAILSRNLYDLALVVTRYFGGVKLGLRGLIEAYGEAAALALEGSPTEEVLVVRPLELVSDYQRFQELLHRLRGAGLDESLWKVSYLDRVAVTAYVPLDLEEALAQLVQDYSCHQLLTEPPRWLPDLQGLAKKA